MHGLIKRGRLYHISKTIKVKGKGEIRLRESTGQSDEQLAKEVFNTRVQEETQRLLYGLRRPFLFSEGAAKYLKEKQKLGKNVQDDIYHLDLLMPHIGHIVMSSLHNQHDGLAKFKESRDGCKSNTINLSLEKVRRILNLSAHEWIEDEKTWLAVAPKIKLLPTDDEDSGYPITWGQQRVLFALLPDHLRLMALFAINTGVRDEYVCGLKWSWERRIPGLGSVFDLPTSKNGRPYRVPLNRIAREVVESRRGVDREYVFAYPGNFCPIGQEKGSSPVGTMNNTSWQKARERAGLNDVRGPGAHFRVHDLRTTFATRLREAGVSREDRKDLMGHVNQDITTHYSKAETSKLLACVERIVVQDERPSVYVVAQS
jgi:integrase